MLAGLSVLMNKLIFIRFKQTDLPTLFAGPAPSTIAFSNVRLPSAVACGDLTFAFPALVSNTLCESEAFVDAMPKGFRGNFFRYFFVPLCEPFRLFPYFLDFL